MKIGIRNENTRYEIEMQQITQLCGTDFSKKDFILKSIQKYFSNTRYAEYEACYQDNVEIEGEKVGRKYFSCYTIGGREDLIHMINLGKSGLMMEYLMEKITDFECHRELDDIAEHLERLYIQINKEIAVNVSNIEISYEPKNLLEIIQTSRVTAGREEPLEKLSNYELLETYLDLFLQMQRRKPEKSLLIVKNIDHLLNYQEYFSLFERVRKDFAGFDTWFLFSTSLEGFAVLEREFFTGINIVNDIVYALPEQEEVFAFIRNHYPCEKELEIHTVMEGLRHCIQKIGKEKCNLNVISSVILKLINGSLCMDSFADEGINRLENSFLISKNMI